MRESERVFARRHQRYHLLSAATLNNSRNRNFVHRKDHGRIEAGISVPFLAVPAPSSAQDFQG